MKYAIIGSTAIKHWYNEFREPKDLDLVCSSNPNIKTTKKIEILTNPIILNNIDNWTENHIIKPDILYNLKISHCFWDINWEKHIKDLAFLKKKGLKLNQDLVLEFYNYWTLLHKRKTSNLEMSAKEFFNNNVKFPIKHDLIHEQLIKHPYFNNQLKPTYNQILKENEEVNVDESKFKQLSHTEKFNLVFEEIAIMATERYNTMYYREAYHKMLKKFILNHCPIWEGIWILDNIEEIYTTIPFNFIKYLNYEFKINQ